jgi:macrolide-specific efflux system membrane fusion protein
MPAERPAPNSTSAASAATGSRARASRARTVAILAVVAAVAGGYYYWQRDAADGGADRPLIATTAYGDVENTVAAAGNLQPSNTVPVGAQVSGQLRKVHVHVGDQVTTGQLLGEIDARVQVNKVAASEANIASAEAQLEARRSALDLARANAERAERLMGERATSQQEYDSAMNNLATAEASYFAQVKSIEQNKATLSTDKTQLEYTNLFAPIDGTVVSMAMKEGTTLNATQQSPTVMSIANLATMTVETQISEADVGKLWIGMDVYFNTLSGGTRRWYSTLRQILPTPTATNNVVTYTGLFDVDNTDGALLSGMTTQVYFVTSAARAVLTVPVGALTFAAAPRPEGLGPRASAAGGVDGGGRAAGGPQGPARPERGATPRDASGGARRFDEVRFARGGNAPGGAVPDGGFDAALGNAGGLAAASRRAQAPRQAKVRVVNADGSFTERDVTVGVTSRVTAEVIAGLAEGEQVVAGILQAAVPGTGGNQNQNPNQFFNQGGFPGGGFPGGFPNNNRGR